MIKIALTAGITAACCFAIAAATGFGAAAPKVLTMKVNEIITLKSDNFHCQALNTTQVACGANKLANSTQVYFAPHILAVLKFDKSGQNAKTLYTVKR
ncbi:MAG TPA: hypothetical protein VGM80_09550 [Gaiellaceae bacterium]|jgi:hypothetical protein